MAIALSVPNPTEPELRPRIKSIVVREFEGIDHLPDSLQELLALEP